VLKIEKENLFRKKKTYMTHPHVHAQSCICPHESETVERTRFLRVFVHPDQQTKKECFWRTPSYLPPPPRMGANLQLVISWDGNRGRNIEAQELHFRSGADKARPDFGI
jgi:hypothetical protein